MASKINLSLQVASAGVYSKAMVLLLFIHCLLLLHLFVKILYCCGVLCVLSRFAIIPLGLPDIYCLLDAMLQLSFFDSSLRCHGAVDWSVVCDCGIS